jgi:hypothetical protein
MMDTYELWYYRTSQADNLAQAIQDGAVRKHTLDGPSKNLLDGCAADAVALIAQATDMMEHGAQIEYNLLRFTNGHEFIIDRKVRPS